uniref:Protein phosphatase 2C like domain containing 1 n=1 Tax=Pipistrellus kuhlii TaxID=59472 RepID=A0A7J7WEN7_PIPKU|nr:protein phosphatase 2C like domain containing 1 [Pipistrellus kuhlii]
MSKDLKTNAFRVFWKARKWNMKKFEFEEDFLLFWRRKYLRRKEERRLSFSETQQEQQLCDQIITFPCSMCKKEIDLTGFFLHKKQHVALATLGLEWKSGITPARSAVAGKRKFTITKLMSSSTFTEKGLESMNNALEVLWKKQMPEYYKIMENIHNSTIHSQRICHLLIKGAAVCTDKNSTWKVDMNDKFTIANNFGSKLDVCFFGLFDGHHGPTAADFASKELPVLLLHQLSKFDPSYQMTLREHKLINSFQTVFRKEYIALENLFSVNKETKEPPCKRENIHKAFAKAFWRMDRLLRLGREEVSRVQWSGCSAVACVLEGKLTSSKAKKNQRRPDHDDWSERFPSQRVPQVISGELHIAHTGNVQAVLCRNGKGFCLTKEHTLRNKKEKKRVLENGARISSNEPYGLLEGQTKTTRGLGFHGNPKLKNFIIPVPQTLSVPIDDLCQFLILATNGLWQVLDKKEVTALAITMFQMYKEIHYFNLKKRLTKDSLFSPVFGKKATEPESNTHTSFQRKSEEWVPSTNLKEKLSSVKNSKNFTRDPKNTQTFLPEMTNCDTCSEKATDKPTHEGGVPGDSIEKQKIYPKHFYEAAAEYISHGLVSAALVAGSRDNITVMVILLNGSEYQFLK